MAQDDRVAQDERLPPRLRPERPPLLFLKGALMGAADVVPGVSGGTVALLVGVYERLIAGLGALFSVPGRLLRGGTQAAAEQVALVPWRFLLVLGAGLATAVLIGAWTLPGFIASYPILSAALFFGLILGSIPVAWRRIGAPGLREYGLAAGAALIAFLLVGIPPRTIEDPAWWLIVGGAMIAITAMALPGVSGAYLLLVLGLYTATLEALRRIDLTYIALFALGALLGAVLIVRLLDFLLAERHRATLSVLVGLMIGGLRATWPWLDADRTLLAPPMEPALLALPIGMFLAGFLLVRGIDHLARRALGPEPIGAHR